VRAESLVPALRDAAVDRDDVRQEVFITLWAALPRFDPGRASLRTFVERIATTCMVSILRRVTAKKRTQPADYERARDPRQFLVSFEFYLDLDKVLGKLRRRDRRLAQLLLENSPAQVARTLRISRSAVYRSIERIRAALLEAGYKKI
jgi:RNA polymerase sigma factor (sigma-70 family)